MKLTPEQHQHFHQSMQAHDDEVINMSANTTLETLVNPARRTVLKGGLSLAALSFFGCGLASVSAPLKPAQGRIGFDSIQPQTALDFDQVVVANGYTAQPFFSWGDPVENGAPVWQKDASDDWSAQLKQAGDNHDGMHFFAFPEDANRGLMVINHEYINPTLHQNGPSSHNGKRPLDEVKKEQAAHGVSVIEVNKGADGQWVRVYPSPYNRRISTMTPMQISGPLAGHDLMKTVADPLGLEVIGTMNNCANGFTPWGTYLACEENWHNCFVNKDPVDYAKRVSHKRYGISNTNSSKTYAWETVDPRFDATPDATKAHLGYVQEPHRFGWVVEIDPFDPGSKPIKRTAFGRFCRECATLSLAEDGQMAYYSGDDTKGEYVYKFVPTGKYQPNNQKHNKHLLDTGTLYVAQCNADGSGNWLPLQFGKHGLTPENGFSCQEEILLNARAAADVVGATPMDRPEWAAVNPHSRDVFVTLTNNSERGRKYPLNAANPRPNNLHGHILRLIEKDANPAATTFQWEIFLLAGQKEGSVDKHGTPVSKHLIGNINGDIFSSPDGLGFDKEGRLWILTDYHDDETEMHVMGCNQMLCADPSSKQVKRFLVGPRGCEITGITWSPDYTAMWVNIQHPGLSYPASDGQSRPRSTTVIITKNDGGVIGT